MSRVSIAFLVLFGLIVGLFVIAPLAILAPIGVALNAVFPEGFGPCSFRRTSPARKRRPTEP